MPKRRRYRGTPVPPLHLVLIYVCAGILVLSGIAYYYAPAEKSAAFLAVMTALVGFLTGKFSNGFGKPFIPRDLDQDADLDSDGVVGEASEGATRRSSAPTRRTAEEGR